MTSVNTNAAALTALRNLQNTVSNLETTQNRISTGLRIGEAKDNAAYWAISTTLKSDNKSLATVKDALGLGSATVDVAYQGLTKAKDVLDEIKSKLTAATQNGVDRNVIQAEISSLQDQLKSIATSSVFSGENWLSVDSSRVDYASTKQVVASFARAADNSVSIGTVKVDISNVYLFDSSTAKGAGGILNGAINLKDATTGRDITIGGTDNLVGNTSQAGIANATATGSIAAGATPATNVAGAAATSGAYKATAAFAVSVASGSYTPNAGDKVTLSFNIDGSGAVTVDVPGVGATPDITAITIDNVLTALNGNATLTAKATFSKDANGYLVATSKTTGTSSSVVTAAATETAGGGGSPTFTVAGYAAQGAGATGATGANAVAAKNTTGAAVTLNTAGITATDKMVFDLTIDGTSVKSTVTPGVQLGSNTANDANYQTALAAALNADSTFSAKATASMNSGKLVITSNTSGAASSVTVNSVSFQDSTGAAKNLTGTGLNNVGTAATTTTGAFAPLTLDADDHLYLDVQVDGATAPTTVTIDQALINKTLNVTTGSVTTASDFAKVMNAALGAKNITSVSVAASGGALSFTSKTVGSASSVTISNVAASQGGDQITINTIDISSSGLAKVNATSEAQVKQVLSAYITAVNQAITKVTTAASNLGAVSSRIEMQKTFVNTLMDTIDKGVSNLVDADMTEESTKLQALQVKQQLGTQALSIANQSAQGLLSLFRS